MSAVVVAIAALSATGCADDGGSAAAVDSGVRGQVHVGPQCPVEQVGHPCPDAPAANVAVTVSEQVPGEAYAAGRVVARTTTDASGRFRVGVAPGAYVVTADAGMFCELMDARVSTDTYSVVDVPCDSGIR